MEGEGLRCQVYRRGQCQIIVTYVDQPWVYQTMWCHLSNIPGSSSWIRYLEILHQALPPVCLSLLSHITMHVTESHRLFPSVFAYCKRWKTGGGNGLRMRLFSPFLTSSFQLLEWSPFLVLVWSLLSRCACTNRRSLVCTMYPTRWLKPVKSQLALIRSLS